MYSQQEAVKVFLNEKHRVLLAYTQSVNLLAERISTRDKPQKNWSLEIFSNLYQRLGFIRSSSPPIKQGSSSLTSCECPESQSC